VLVDLRVSIAAERTDPRQPEPCRTPERHLPAVRVYVGPSPAWTATRPPIPRVRSPAGMQRRAGACEAPRPSVDVQLRSGSKKAAPPPARGFGLGGNDSSPPTQQRYHHAATRHGLRQLPDRPSTARTHTAAHLDSKRLFHRGDYSRLASPRATTRRCWPNVRRQRPVPVQQTPRHNQAVLRSR